jgi:hypothetical protein
LALGFIPIETLIGWSETEQPPNSEKKTARGGRQDHPGAAFMDATDENVSGHPQVSDFELEPVSRVEKYLMVIFVIVGMASRDAE